LKGIVIELFDLLFSEKYTYVICKFEFLFACWAEEWGLAPCDLRFEIPLHALIVVDMLATGEREGILVLDLAEADLAVHRCKGHGLSCGGANFFWRGLV
jgi:hypothetical protein